MPPVEAPIISKPEPVKVEQAKAEQVKAEPVKNEPKELIDMTRPDKPSETDILVQKIKAAREAEKNKKKEQ